MLPNWKNLEILKNIFSDFFNIFNIIYKIKCFMKKFLLGILLALTTCVTFGNTEAFKSAKIPDWDKPIKEKT